MSRCKDGGNAAGSQVGTVCLNPAAESPLRLQGLAHVLPEGSSYYTNVWPQENQRERRVVEVRI